MKEIVIKANATFEEVVSISRTVKSVENVPAIETAALFLGARASGNKKLESLCRARLDANSQTESNIRFILSKMYGRYGVDELMYLYQQYSYDDIYAMIRSKVSSLWDELSWNYVSARLADDTLNRNTFFIAHFLRIRITSLYCHQIHELAKERFPELTYQCLKRYVQMRKATGYVFSFSKHTNEQLRQLLITSGESALSDETLNRYRKMFGYEPEQGTSFRPLKEQPAWKKVHRNEVLFWKQTKADTITQQDQDAFLDSIRMQMYFSDEQIADLTNWLMIARYEGRADDNIPTCGSLAMRYATAKERKDGSIDWIPSKIKPIKQMRYEILMYCDIDSIPFVFIQTLSAGIGGKMKGQINKRFA